MSAPISTRALHRLPALDAVRVLGALAVVAHHVGFATGVNTGDGPLSGWLARLDSGVAIFFVLSGFLLFRPYAHARATAAPRPATRRYLWRRALRILPAYWVAVVVSLLVLPGDGISGADWARQLTLTQIYEAYALLPHLGHTWSLATEAVFYLVLPLLAAALLRGRGSAGKPLLILAGGLAVTAAWVGLIAAGVLPMSPLSMWLPTYGLWFAAGMALASAHVSLRSGYGVRRRFLDDLGGAPLACWAAALAVLAVATTPIAGPKNLTEPTASEFAVKTALYAVFAVLILLPVAFGPATRTKAALESGPARWLGTVSYGLFLWHPFVLESVYVLTGRPKFTGDLLSTYLLTVAGGLVLAALSYYVVERPFLRLGHHRPRPPGSTTESQSATAVPTAVS